MSHHQCCRLLVLPGPMVKLVENHSKEKEAGPWRTQTYRMKVRSLYEAESSDLLWFSLKVEDSEWEVEERSLT